MTYICEGRWKGKGGKEEEISLTLLASLSPSLTHSLVPTFPSSHSCSIAPCLLEWLCQKLSFTPSKEKGKKFH